MILARGWLAYEITGEKMIGFGIVTGAVGLAIGPVVSFGEKANSAVPILEKWIGSDDEFSHVTAAGHI